MIESIFVIYRYKWNHLHGYLAINRCLTYCALASLSNLIPSWDFFLHHNRSLRDSCTALSKPSNRHKAARRECVHACHSTRGANANDDFYAAHETRLKVDVPTGYPGRLAAPAGQPCSHDRLTPSRLAACQPACADSERGRTAAFPAAQVSSPDRITITVTVPGPGAGLLGQCRTRMQWVTAAPGGCSGLPTGHVP
jgi:hypothetical protein